MAIIAPAKIKAPRKSKTSPTASRHSSFKHVLIINTPNIPKGTPARKILCHPKLSVRKPPKTGPQEMPAYTEAETSPKAFPLPLGGTTAIKIVIPTVLIMAAPSP